MTQGPYNVASHLVVVSPASQNACAEPKDTHLLEGESQRIKRREDEMLWESSEGEEANERGRGGRSQIGNAASK